MIVLKRHHIPGRLNRHKQILCAVDHHCGPFLGCLFRRRALESGSHLPTEDAFLLGILKVLGGIEAACFHHIRSVICVLIRTSMNGLEVTVKLRP